MRSLKLGLFAIVILMLGGLAVHSQIGGQIIVCVLLAINLLMLVRICRKHSR